jgi:cytochrome c-type biogenesis protein CcmH
MARDMVERLATRLETSPNDPDGWIMLIRSRIVLSEQAEAKAGLKRALDVFAESPEIKRRIRLAAQALGVTIGE